jgi:hypothetical protein
MSIAGPIIGGLLGSGGSSQSGNQTITNKEEIDPRIAAYIFGQGRRLRDGVNPTYTETATPATRQWVGSRDDGDWQMVPGTNSRVQNNPDSDYTTDNGLLGRFSGLLDTPQNQAMLDYGTASGNYLTRNSGDMERMREAALGLMQGRNAPTMNAANVNAAQINAPSQSNLNLRPAYDRMIYGDSAQNPYLTGAIQKGINQSNYAFGNMMRDSTRNLLENVLPGIRGGAILNGTFGSSRQGIAEGKALQSFNDSMNRAATQYGMNNTDSAVAAQAGAYDNGQGRALAAMQGLGSQQYDQAVQNAGYQQQANLANAGYQQQANINNLNANLSTNSMNSANTQAGMQGLNGLLGNAYANAGGQDSYNLNKASKVSGLLAPYVGLNGTSTQTQPLYENKGGGILGGALAGGTIGKMFGGGGGGLWMDPQGSAIDYGGGVRDLTRGALGY